MLDRRERRAANLTAVFKDNLCVFVASACYWAWFDSAVFSPTFFAPFYYDPALYAVHIVATLLFGLPVLLLGWGRRKRMRPFLERDSTLAAVALASVAGGMLVMVGAWWDSWVPVVCGDAFLGVSCSVQLLLWARAYSGCGTRATNVLIPASIALGVAIDVLVAGLAAWFAVAFTLLLPIVSLVAMRIAKRPATPRGEGNDAAGEVLTLAAIFPEGRLKPFGLSLSLVASFSLFGVSFGYVQCVAANLFVDSQGLLSIALLLTRGTTALAVLAAVCLLPRRVYAVFRAGILVGIGGFVVSPLIGLLGNENLVTSIVVTVGYTTFDIITWVLLVELSLTSDSDYASTFGSGRFVVHAGIVVGFILTQVILSMAEAADVWLAFSTMLGYLLVLAEVLLLSENSALWLLVRATVDERAADETTLGNRGPIDDARRVELMQNFSLTEREIEVMRLLLAGRSRPRIAEELCISENTVSTHVRQLYRKLGVHGCQELIDRFS